MHEVDMLCDNVGIINTGNLVAYDTPQGLKDALLESNKRDLTDALTKISDESEDSGSTKDDLEDLSLKKMSVLLKDQDDGIIETISKSENVKSVEIARNGRINLRIDSFDDMAVQNVLNTIISSGGIITSIFTEEPSLEDVFIKSTSEVNEDDRA
jgi:ABC-2 type transport system ATP-binding protein